VNSLLTLIFGSFGFMQVGLHTVYKFYILSEFCFQDGIYCKNLTDETTAHKKNQRWKIYFTVVPDKYERSTVICVSL